VYHSAVVPELPPLAPDQPTDDVIPAYRPVSRRRALAEVVICSGFPTQLAIVGVLAAVGIVPEPSGTLSPAFVFTLSALDTVLLIGLVLMFLRQSHDRPRDVFLGTRLIPGEISFGVMFLPVVFMAVIVLQLLIRLVAPTLHNVEVSPFTPLLRSPWLLAGFVVLVLAAGGIREELQRAFLLHRFEQRLGGSTLGVVVTSTAFGLGHTVQGWDAALITAMLGALWGAMYIARRSVVATVTNHALFNLAQIALGYATLVRT
jgi:membrane protease YdiL (CAAX protease family)